jgi:hypothetical protein
MVATSPLSAVHGRDERRDERPICRIVLAGDRHRDER